MPWIGSNFSRGFTWVSDVAIPQILRSRHDTNDNDFEGGIDECINKNGANEPTVALPMGGFNHSGVGDATARDEYLSMAQFQDSGGKFVTTTGTAPSFVATLSPAITSYQKGQNFFIEFHEAAVGSDVINFNTLGDIEIRYNNSATIANAWGANQTVMLTYDGTYFNVNGYLVNGVANGIIPRGYIDGMITSNGTDADHDIDISAGVCRSSDNALTLSLAAGITKRIDSNWSAGTGNGGFPSALSLSNDTWYHVFIIGKADGTTDAGYDSDITATNLLADATDYIAYRRIGSVLTDGSANILLYLQTGDRFEFVAIVSDYSAVSLGAASLLTLTTPIDVKVKMFGELYSSVTDTTNDNRYAGIWDADLGATSNRYFLRVYTINTNNINGSTYVESMTNTSSQVYIAGSGWSGSETVYLYTHGWVDLRGKE